MASVAQTRPRLNFKDAKDAKEDQRQNYHKDTLLVSGLFCYLLETMNVYFTPEQEQQIAQLAAETGTDAEQLVKNIVLRMLGEQPDSRGTTGNGPEGRKQRLNGSAGHESSEAVHPAAEIAASGWPGMRSRTKGDSRSAAKKVRPYQSRSSRQRVRGNPGGRVGVVGPTRARTSLTATPVMRSSEAALVKLKWRAADSNTRSASREIFLGIMPAHPLAATASPAWSRRPRTRTRRSGPLLQPVRSPQPCLLACRPRSAGPFSHQAATLLE